MYDASLDSQYFAQEYLVPVVDGEIKARCLIPSRSSEGRKEFPLLVWFRGGGYCFGSVEVDEPHLRKVCIKHQVVIVGADYRLAPEYLFPTGINDAYATSKWATENAALLSASLSLGFIVAGISAGGNFAAWVVLQA